MCLARRPDAVSPGPPWPLSGPRAPVLGHVHKLPSTNEMHIEWSPSKVSEHTAQLHAVIVAAA